MLEALIVIAIFFIFVGKATKVKIFSNLGFIFLIIPVGIIGVLTAVGIPMYQGYIATAKVNTSKENHTKIEQFINDSFTQCYSGASEIILSSSSGYISCDSSTTVLASQLVEHFNNNGWKNPHDDSQHCCTKSSSNPPLEDAPNTHIYAVSDTEITIKTNVGTDKWLTSTVLKK
jgi:type IV pilus assembly protein PilA